MTREIIVRGLDEALGASITALQHFDSVLVLRAAPNFLVCRQKWSEFLETVCRLVRDRRQYTVDEHQLFHTDWWEISNQPDKAGSYAHSTTSQPFHSDNAWFSDPAEINFFVMVRQAVFGGEQLIYPASRLFSDLSRNDPGLFRDLLSTKVTIQKGDGRYKNCTTILREDDGPKVFWNYNRVIKDQQFTFDLCERFSAFLKSMEDSSSVDEIRCGDNDCFAFNDQRLLHARRSFVASRPRERILLQSMWRLPEDRAED
jgi:hypothetical protein